MGIDNGQFVWPRIPIHVTWIEAPDPGISSREDLVHYQMGNEGNLGKIRLLVVEQEGLILTTKHERCCPVVLGVQSVFQHYQTQKETSTITEIELT